MNRRVAGGTVVVLAVAIVRVLWSGEGPIYVSGSTQLLLVAALPFLLGFGAWALLGRSDATAHDDHAHASGVWALLVLPLLLLGVVAPQPLGVYSVEQQGARPAPVQPSKSFAPLPASEPVVLTLQQYWERSALGGQATLEGRRVQLVGFATASTQPGAPWSLARLRVWCCAADALPFKVGMLGADRPADGTWLEVTGTYAPADAAGNVYLRVDSVRRVPQPQDPYLR